MRKFRAEAGFTIVEVLVASMIVLVGVVAALSLIDRANATTVTTKSREGATSLARELVESVRAVQYDRLTHTTLLTELAAQPGLADVIPGGAYTLTRRNITYTITGSVCTMDDPSDGGGTQTGGNFCPGSAGLTAPADRAPEDYKRAAVNVSWRRSGVTRTVTQTALVNNPGSAGVPFVQSIASSPVTPPAITSAIDSVSLRFVTSSAAASLNWMVDGSVRTPAAAPDAARVNWNVEWNITDAVDGPYVIGAEAYDAQGAAGPTRQLTIQLNRRPPAAPTGVSGGRNRFGDVEIEWAPNPERDIVGYEVRRGTEVVCSLAALGTATECRQSNPPPEAGGDQTYTVYAFDRDGNGVNRASPGTAIAVIVGNVAPEMPAQVRLGSGGATLAWNRPSPEDLGPSGDRISYYRIYRDGRGYANRYASWYASEADVTWTDPNPDGMSHTYWVTSVDTHRLESDFAGGMTK